MGYQIKFQPSSQTSGNFFFSLASFYFISKNFLIFTENLQTLFIDTIPSRWPQINNTGCYKKKQQTTTENEPSSRIWSRAPAIKKNPPGAR